LSSKDGIDVDADSRKEMTDLSYDPGFIANAWAMDSDYGNSPICEHFSQSLDLRS
jgi:hypothetical protein